MRGRRNPQSTMLAFVNLDERVPPDHPLRIIKRVADDVLDRMSDDFEQMYSKIGRASVPPERLLKSLLLISLYSIRSERAFCQELDYNLLYRWFLDMDLMEPSFDATVFTKNRRRLLRHKVGRKLFEEVAYEADRRGLMSDEHFSVDGTLIEAAASIKSFRRRDDDDDSMGDGGVQTEDFRGEKLSNATHRSTTDPDARLMRKGPGKEAKLVFMAHALMDNRHGLVSDFRLTEANGMAERDAALEMLTMIPGSRQLSVGADRGYDTRDFVAECRELNVSPHVARKKRWSAIDGRTTRHETYRSSQKVRKRVESIFGWMKTVGGFRRSRYVGVERTGLCGELVATAYNLVRMSRLIAEREAEVPVFS